VLLLAVPARSWAQAQQAFKSTRMESIMNRSFFLKNATEQLIRFVQNRTLRHAAFWLSFFMLYALSLYINQHSPLFAFVTSAISTSCYALIVYTNLLYLIPNFLTEKKFGQYSLLLILSVFIFTSLKVFTLHALYFQHPQQQVQVLKDQAYMYFLNFIVAGGVTLYKIVTDWFKQQKEHQLLQTQTMQSELKFLRSQINPHFLFNTLNNLYALTLKKSDKAPDIVLKLSDMMRYMLYECNEKQVFLYKEVNYLQNYLELERLRQGKHMDISFAVNGKVGEHTIAPLMFIPFVENSFKHGVSNQIASGFVNIVMDIEGEHLHLHIENSKPVMPPMQEPRRSGGIGLVNVRRRLNILYPGQHTLEIQDSPTVYSVDLTIQLDSNL
jgi:two-component system LytT family sensor kinase